MKKTSDKTPHTFKFLFEGQNITIYISLKLRNSQKTQEALQRFKGIFS